MIFPAFVRTVTTYDTISCQYLFDLLNVVNDNSIYYNY